jgi:hypothetical protein
MNKKEFKKDFQNRLNSYLEKKRIERENQSLATPPRYDDVFFDGLEYLNNIERHNMSNINIEDLSKKAIAIKDSYEIFNKLSAEERDIKLSILKSVINIIKPALPAISKPLDIARKCGYFERKFFIVYKFYSLTSDYYYDSKIIIDENGKFCKSIVKRIKQNKWGINDKFEYNMVSLQPEDVIDHFDEIIKSINLALNNNHYSKDSELLLNNINKLKQALDILQK